MKPVVICFAFACLAGCATVPDNTADPAPRYAHRIQIARYDTAIRPPTAKLDVYQDDKSVPRPFHVIALLSHEAYPEDEGRMMNAIAWNARQIGADAIVLLLTPKPGSTVSWSAFGGGSKNDQPVFHAHAIVFDK